MHRYRAFNLTIESELAFRELLPCDESAATKNQAKGDDRITIAFHDVSHNGLPTASLTTAHYQANNAQCWLNIPAVARFLITNGHRIDIDPCSDTDEDSIRLFVLGSCMGALLMQRQLLLLHGNAIKIGHQCVSFIGDSGAGKSTTSAAFFKRGYSILADDICALDDLGNVLPSFPQIKLWADAARQLMISTNGLRQIRPHFEKFAVPLNQQFHSYKTPLRIIYLLEKHTQATIQMDALEGLEKVQALQRHVYRKEYLADALRQRLCLKQCMMLASKLTLVRIRRPAHEFALNELIHRIITDLTDRNMNGHCLTRSLL